MPNPQRSARRIIPPPDLTIPEPGSTTARTILSQAISRLLTELPAVGRGFAASPALHADVQTFHAFWRELMRNQPGALPSLLRRVSIATLLRTLRQHPSEALISEFIGLVYFELALMDGLEKLMEQRCPPRRFMSLGGQLVMAKREKPRSITYANGLVVIDGAQWSLDAYSDVIGGFSRENEGVVVSRPYHAITDEIVLALEDNNPLSMFEAHPDKQGNAIDLGGKPVEEWTRVLREGLDLIAEFLPDLRKEMDLFVQQIVPVGFDEQKHLSASYQEAIGTIYMSLHPSLMTMTEALIHEFSHNKINALFELDGVLENAFSPLYTSPVRPDPRPLHGVLLAVHAFLPVARLYEKMIDAKHPLAQNAAFLARFEKIRHINAEGADVVLGNGRPTEVGKAVLDEIRRWDGYYRKLVQ